MKTKDKLAKDQELEDKNQEFSEEELEKALDSALNDLNKSNSNQTVTTEKDEKDEEDEGDEEEVEYEESKPKKEPVKKSKTKEDLETLTKSIPETLDEEAEEIMDAVPFIKSLVDSLESQFLAMTKSLIAVKEEVEDLKISLTKSQALNVAQAKLVKSMNHNLKILGNSPNDLRSTISKSMKIVRKSKTGSEENDKKFTPTQVLEQLQELQKSGKIGLREIVATETRLNKGLPPSDRVLSLLS